jgi:hypothetical protein
MKDYLNQKWWIHAKCGQRIVPSLFKANGAGYEQYSETVGLVKVPVETTFLRGMSSWFRSMLSKPAFLENLTYSTQIIYQLAVAAAAVNSF